MACKGCIERQKKLVKWTCKKPDSSLCRKAKERLKKMQAQAAMTPNTRQ